ncbi:hypothetical protein MHB42_19250 [Lysinibacillus sp. FSL K6-0232]|uniref:hypothetical protein n=1 Tax=unclassified Lysinibacillus TaxID=2636778 RepID=UPI0030F76BBB
MNDIFSIIAFVAVAIYFLSKHSEALEKFNKMQKIGVLISYIMTTIVAGICIHYGGSFLTEPFQNGFLILIIRFAVVMIVLWLAVFTLNHILQKITNGIIQKIT